MDRYGTGFESSYSPDLYSAPSPYEWQDAAAGPKHLAWKLAGLPPSPSVQKSNNTVVRRAEAPFPPPAPAGALAASRPTAQLPSKPFAAAATAAVFTTSVLPERSAPSAVLGTGIAGYTSVVTRTPISPSGYSVPIQPKHMPAQQQQQPQTSAHGNIRTYGDPQLLSSSYGQPSEYAQGATASSSSYMASGTPASAAAAALAALAGNHSRSSSATAAGYAQQYAPRNYAPQPAPASTTSGAKGSMLMWNVKQLPSQPGSAAGQHSGAGAGACGTGRLISTAPNASSGSSGSGRPPSQEAGSAGLAKLKQLSTARLVRRLGTPPGAAKQQDSTTDSGYFGSRPAASAAAAGLGSTLPSSPIAGRRAAGVQPTQRQQQQHDSVQVQQMQQRQAQAQQMQHARQQPAQQQARHDAINLGRPTEPSLNRRRTSNSSSSSSQRGPAGAAVQDTHTNTFSSSGSNRNVQPAPSGRAHSMAGTGAIQHTVQAQLPAGAEYQEVDRQPCPSCGRCFAPPALQQHMRICDKVFGQKRKAFDIKAQRLQGTGAAAAAGRAHGNSAGGSRPGQQQRNVSHDKRPAVSTAQAKKSKWQLQSEQLRAAMRATRPQAAGAGAAGGCGGAAQVEEVEDTRVQCPHCGRRFAELVAQRHIPKCSDIIAKPSRLKAAGGRAAYMRVNSGGRR